MFKQTKIPIFQAKLLITEIEDLFIIMIISLTLSDFN